MKAFLDPGWRREFAPARELDPLPKTVKSQKVSSSQRRPGRDKPKPVKAKLLGAQRELWTASVKDWLRQHDRGADWELPKADEKVLFEWFEAIDIDRSGTVDSEEIRALLAANQTGCSPARIEALFKTAGKQPHDELKLHDFVKLMHLGGAAQLFSRNYEPPAVVDDPFGGVYAGHGGAPDLGGAYTSGAHSVHEVVQPAEAARSTLSECRSSGDLAVLAYRRQRVLNDLRDPTKRAPFATHDTFLRKYAPGARKEYLSRWAANANASSEGELNVKLSDAERRQAAEGTYLRNQLAATADEELAAAEADAAAAAAAAASSLGSPSLPKLSPNGRLRAHNFDQPPPRADKLRGSISLPRL